MSNPQDYIDARASTERLADQIEVIRATGETVYLETGRAVRDEALTAGMGKYQNVAGAAIGAGRRAGGVMDSFGDEAAGAARDGHQVTRNAAEGRRRQQGAHDELVAEHPNASVQSEQYLRTSDGVRAIDPLTGTGRRIDNVVIQDGQAVRSVETTSLTADKRLQQQHEARVREAGGTFVRDRQTRELVDLSEVPTEIDRRE